jgi:hypothetical protein
MNSSDSLEIFLEAVAEGREDDVIAYYQKYAEESHQMAGYDGPLHIACRHGLSPSHSLSFSLSFLFFPAYRFPFSCSSYKLD